MAEKKKNEKSNTAAIFFLVLILLTAVAASIYIYALQNTPTTNENPTDVDVSEQIVVEELIVSNITSNSVSISWVTNNNTEAFIRYGLSADNLSSVATTSIAGEKKVHYVNIINLTENQTYFYNVASTADTITNASVLNFKTFEASDGIDLPDTLLISLPTTFSNGVVYVQGSNGSEVSYVTSSFAITSNTTIDKNNLDKGRNGTSFGAGNSAIKIAATSKDGTRYTQIVSMDADKATLGESTTTNAIFNSSVAFDPSQAVASGDPVVPDPDPDEEEPDDDEPTEEPEPDPDDEIPDEEEPIEDEDEEVPISAPVSRPLPTTAFGDDLERDFILIAGVILLIFGIRLFRTNSEKDNDDFF